MTTQNSETRTSVLQRYNQIAAKDFNVMTCDDVTFMAAMTSILKDVLEEQLLEPSLLKTKRFPPTPTDEGRVP